MDRLIVFGGTTEGRELCQKCLEQLNNVVIHVFVATEQGKEVLPKDGKLVVHTGRLTSMEMADIIGTLSPDMVVDATHPYATEVTENIVKACTLSNARYIRLLREKADIKKGFIAEDPLKVVKLVNRSRGNVLLTTGSKDLPAYTIRANPKSRVQFHYSLNRRLTVRECARIQTFPDDFKFGFAKTVSISQIGNAVPPVLASCVAESIANYLKTVEEMQ